MKVLDQFRLDGQVALVTGCRRGIGKAMTLALAEAGADIIGVSASLESAKSLIEAEVRSLGRQFKGYACDFSDRKALRWRFCPGVDWSNPTPGREKKFVETCKRVSLWSGTLRHRSVAFGSGCRKSLAAGHRNSVWKAPIHLLPTRPNCVRFAGNGEYCL